MRKRLCPCINLIDCQKEKLSLLSRRISAGISGVSLRARILLALIAIPSNIVFIFLISERLESSKSRIGVQGEATVKLTQLLRLTVLKIRPCKRERHFSFWAFISVHFNDQCELWFGSIIAMEILLHFELGSERTQQMFYTRRRSICQAGEAEGYYFKKWKMGCERSTPT